MTDSSAAAAAAAPPPVAGSEAPDFMLPSTSGESVTLSSFRGRQPVLLAFFPLAFTSTCTAELCGFSENFDALSEAGVLVLPISVDSVPTLREFRARYALRTELLSDFKREASRSYGVLLPEPFYSTRAYFLVGADGRVLWSHVEENPGMKRDDAEILERIRELVPPPAR